MREKVLSDLENTGLLAILRGVSREALLPLTEELLKSGLRLMELTYSASGDVSDEEMAERVRLLHETFGDDLSVGSGTVLSEEQVLLTKQAGGSFIVSPDVNEAVIRRTVGEGLVSMPGALTPTEMMTAHRAGADFIKIFPAGPLGTSYVKQVHAPLSHLKLLAVGGFPISDIPNYVAAGAVGFGIGKALIDPALIAAGDYAAIGKRTRDALALIATAKRTKA